MQDTEIWTKLTVVFHETFDDDGIKLRPETTAQNVEGWDSLSNIQLMVAVEKTFGIRLKTAELTGLANVGELVRVIRQRTEPSR